MSDAERIQDLLAQLPSPQIEERLAPLLRRVSEQDRLAIIRQLIGNLDTAGAGFRLAARCLETNEVLEQIVHGVVDTCNASNSGHWLKPFIGRLGYRTVLQILIADLRRNPKGVRKTRYWLPSLLPADSKPAQDLLLKLDEGLEEARDQLVEG